MLKHRSKIVGEQLGAHLDQLVSLGFLRSYALTPAEGREGIVLTFARASNFKPIPNLLRAPRPGEAKFTFRGEEREVGTAHRVPYLFQEKLLGRKADASMYVSSNDVATAKELLAHVTLEDMPDFLDYALREAGKTRFDLRTLGSVRQYLSWVPPDRLGAPCHPPGGGQPPRDSAQKRPARSARGVPGPRKLSASWTTCPSWSSRPSRPGHEITSPLKGPGRPTCSRPSCAAKSCASWEKCMGAPFNLSISGLRPTRANGSNGSYARCVLLPKERVLRPKTRGPEIVIL